MIVGDDAGKSLRDPAELEKRRVGHGGRDAGRPEPPRMRVGYGFCTSLSVAGGSISPLISFCFAASTAS
jgi:hypothetical protein